MTRRIGILGGSFDPIHLGHLTIAQDSLEQFELDQALFVPAYRAPLKSKAPIASPDQRMWMTRLAVEGNERFSVCDADFREEAISYSIDTIRRLKTEYLGDRFFWILGTDQLAQLHKWRSIDELVREVTFIAFERSGSGADDALDELPDHAEVLFAKPRVIEFSSTEIRSRLKSGLSVKYFLPASVFDYIKAEHLYFEDEHAYD